MTTERALDEALSERLGEIYRDLHEHPELSFAEERTAGIVAERLAEQGYEVTTGVGRTGVVGVLHNGDGLTALLRADMDALPLRERTGLPYASTATSQDSDGQTVPVMHACGHDMHVTWLLGATELLSANRSGWSGTVLAVFQPAEELGAGAQAMIEHDFLERFPRPDVCLAQHVSPFPAGLYGVREGITMAAADSLRITLHGNGGHGSSPHTTVDPVVMAAAVVLRLQSIVSRELDPNATAVVTVGSLHAGSAPNVIPDRAELQVNLRTLTPEVREQVLGAIRRIVEAEASASNAPRAPEIETLTTFPATTNDAGAVERVRAAIGSRVGHERVFEAPLVSGSEDFGIFGTTAQVPSVFWFTGGVDPVMTPDFIAAITSGAAAPPTPGNHSPEFAPDPAPTIEAGVQAMHAAALEWLGHTP